MNKEVKPKIIFNGSFEKDAFTVIHTDSNIRLSSDQLKIINSNWKNFEDEAKAKGGQVWDGTYYRLENLSDIRNELYFSTIKYSTIRGLTHNEDLSKIPLDSRPNHISTASLIQTIDGFFVFGVRNNNSMSSKKIDLIGGGLQPDELTVEKCSDIFETQLKEIKEEVGITYEQIDNIEGIGITLSSKYNVIFIFYTKLKISKAELTKCFKDRTDDEMQDLEFVAENELQEYLKDKGSYRPLTAELYFKNK